MNSGHHEQLAFDLVRAAGLLKEQLALGDCMIHCLNKFGSELARMSSFPDRLRDLKIDFPGLPPEYEIWGQNFSSLQHFCNQFGSGFCWKNDPSLPPLSYAGLKILDAELIFCPQLFGERAPVEGPTPLEQFLTPGQTLATFVFPSAANNLHYYANLAKKYWPDNMLYWIQCVGCCFHYLADMHVPHHYWGALKYGHQELENGAENQWKQETKNFQLASDPTLFRTVLLPAVLERYKQYPTIEDLLGDLPTFGQPRELYEADLMFAKDLSLQILAKGLAMLLLLLP
jgi:hypothetical protein